MGRAFHKLPNYDTDSGFVGGNSIPAIEGADIAESV